MIFSDLASPTEAGFALGSGLWPARAQAPAGNRFPSPIGVEDMLFGIMRYFGSAKASSASAGGIMRKTLSVIEIIT